VLPVCTRRQCGEQIEEQRFSSVVGDAFEVRRLADRLEDAMVEPQTPSGP